MRAFKLGVFGLVAAGIVPIYAQQIQINKENKTIAITTSDQAEALADTAVVTVGFHLYGKDQDGTYAESSKVSNAIMTAVMSAGVSKEAIESSDQALSPLEERRDEDKIRFGQGFRFEFQQSWEVTVQAADAAKVLHIAITAGGNDSGSIKWQLKQDGALEAEAAKRALEHARQIATQMASGLGVKLGALVYASNQSPSRLFVDGFMGGANDTVTVTAEAEKKKIVPLAISPDKVTKSATVYAVFAID